MSPLRALRESLAQIPHQKENTTQAGFARLIGRSESLVRAVESGRVALSGKLARELSARTGVPVELLMKKEVSMDEMPGIQACQIDGGLLSGRYILPASPDMNDNTVMESAVKLGKWFESDPKRQLRKKLISSVLIALDDLSSACSDEELAMVTSELREWMYARLAKMAKSVESSES